LILLEGKGKSLSEKSARRKPEVPYMTERSRPASFAAFVLAATLAGLSVSPATAADEPDLIFKRSTVFKWLTPDDKLATYGLDDPEVDGVACHFTVPEKGGLKGWIGIAEEVSDISLACRVSPAARSTGIEAWASGAITSKKLVPTAKSLQSRVVDQPLRWARG
jgi:CreA protein